MTQVHARVSVSFKGWLRPIFVWNLEMGTVVGGVWVSSRERSCGSRKAGLEKETLGSSWLSGHSSSV